MHLSIGHLQDGPNGLDGPLDVPEGAHTTGTAGQIEGQELDFDHSLRRRLFLRGCNMVRLHHSLLGF